MVARCSSRLFAMGESIPQRPKEINRKEVFRHWEIDTVMGKRTNDKVLLTITERLTRYEYMFVIDKKDCLSIKRYLIDLKNNIKRTFQRYSRA